MHYNSQSSCHRKWHIGCPHPSCITIWTGLALLELKFTLQPICDPCLFNCAATTWAESCHIRPQVYHAVSVSCPPWTESDHFSQFEAPRICPPGVEPVHFNKSGSQPSLITLPALSSPPGLESHQILCLSNLWFQKWHTRGGTCMPYWSWHWALRPISDPSLFNHSAPHFKPPNRKWPGTVNPHFSIHMNTFLIISYLWVDGM